MKFKDLNKPDDKYYLDIEILDNMDKYITTGSSYIHKFATAKMIYHASCVVHLLLHDKETDKPLENAVLNYGDRYVHNLNSLVKSIGSNFAPNINLNNISKEDAIILGERFYGYFNPRKHLKTDF